MAIEIINTLRSASVIRCVDAGLNTIELTGLRKNTTTENVTSASIKKLVWSSNGYITVARGLNSVNTNILQLSGSGEMNFDELGYSISTASTGNVIVNIVTGGTIVMELSKTATYNVDPVTGVTIP